MKMNSIYNSSNEGGIFRFVGPHLLDSTSTVQEYIQTYESIALPSVDVGSTKQSFGKTDIVGAKTGSAEKESGCVVGTSR